MTLPGAVFELHRVRSDLADPDARDMLVTFTLKNGVYCMNGRSATSDASTQITSDSSGVIKLGDLEPNSYYFKEITAPTGYRYSDEKYHFTVSVNAGNTAAETSYGAGVTSVCGVNGLPNEENLSSLTLTKVDKTDYDENQATAETLPNTTYNLLRLKKYMYRDSSAENDTEAAYLTNAKAALTEEGGSIDTYWDDVGTYVTDGNGEITAEGQMFGVYAFYEVKAPTGYDRDFTLSTASSTDAAQSVIGRVTLNSGVASTNGALRYSLTHLEPRSKANVRILKTNENGDPLRGAVFKLYWHKDSTTDILIAEGINTDYDGMNDSAIVLDPAEFDWDAVFWFEEVTAPTGYATNNDGSGMDRIYFTLDRATAEEGLHIVRAKDAKLKGQVTLTKTAAAPASTSTTFHGLSVGAPMRCGIRRKRPRSTSKST